MAREAPTAAVKELADDIPQICWDWHRVCLIIESAVRRADPDNHAEVLAVINANQDIVCGRAKASPRYSVPNPARLRNVL